MRMGTVLSGQCFEAGLVPCMASEYWVPQLTVLDITFVP